MKINFKHMSAKAWFTNIIMFVCACFLFSPQAYSATVDFSDLTLAPESYWNGSDNSGGFSSGGAFFNNSYYYDSTYNYESWSGWAQSNITNNTTSGYTNQYSAITGGGVHGPGSNYVLADDFDPNDSYINLPVGKRADALVVTNSTCIIRCLMAIHLPKSLLQQIGSSLRSQAIQVDPQQEIRRVPSISIWLRILVLSIAGKR